MKILILSNGPSLKHAEIDNTQHDLVIAVTKAATVHPCHWWVVGDDDVFNCIPDLVGEPMFIFLNKEISIHKGADYMRSEREWLKGRGYILKWIDVPNAREKSGPAALALARYLIANAPPTTEKIVDCYGVDMTGSTDCQGGENETRDDSRWARERRLWEANVAACEREGIDVRVHHPSLLR